MADELLNYLTTDRHHAKISPEMLELMGKQASNMFLDSGLSLNEAVVKIASEHEDINQEQLKRICEFANTSTYLARHDQNKVAGANSSYPQFELADPARVIQDMSDGARPTVVTKTDLDYSKQPLKSKVSSPELEAAFEDMFKAKTAEVDLGYSRDTAVEEVMSAKIQLVALKDHLSSVGEHFDLALKEASAEFYELTKRHLLDGGDFADVMVAARSSGSTNEKIAAVMKPVVSKLLMEKVSNARTLQDGVRRIEKVAHRVVNEEHPLVRSFREILTATDEIEKIATGLEEVEGSLTQVNSFIKETVRGAVG